MQVFIPGLGWVLVCWLVQGRERGRRKRTSIVRAWYSNV